MPSSWAHAPIQFLPNPETGCWEWQRTLTPAGYGQMRVQHKLYPAHRFFYEFLVGPIPEGMELDHLCRVRHCVNPDHLEPVSRTVNAQRGSASKLSDHIAEIRGALGTNRELGRRYGVSHTTIGKIRNGTSWTNVE